MNKIVSKTLRPSIKDIRTKSRKIDPPPSLSAKYPHCSPSPPCPCGHTLNFEMSGVIFHQKVRTSASKETPCPQYVRGQKFSLSQLKFLSQALRWNVSHSAGLKLNRKIFWIVMQKIRSKISNWTKNRKMQALMTSMLEFCQLLFFWVCYVS